MTIRTFRPAVAALLAAAAFTGTANAASLIGDSITSAYYFPTASTVYGNFTVSPSPTFTVGAGTEASALVDGFINQTFDFDANSLTVTLLSNVTWTSAVFNGWQFVNNSNVFDAISSVTGIDPSRVSVSGNTLSVNWESLAFTPESQIVINFGVVPEPASWMMLIGGFGLVGAAMRRRAAVSAA